MPSKSSVGSSAACEALEGRRLLTAITTGQRLTGTIAALGQEASFEFSLNAGDRFAFLAASTGSPVTPRLDIYAPNGMSVGTAAGGVSAAVELVAGTTGVYSARVRDSADNDTGGFAVSLFRTRVVQPIDADSGGLESGRSYGGTVDLGDLDVYAFPANAGDQILLGLGRVIGGTSYAPRLTLYAPDGTIVSNTVDGSGAVIELPTLSQSGSYTAVVRDVGDNDSGQYRLSFVRTGQPQARDADGGPLLPGVRTYGSLDFGDFDVYTFDAQVGDSVELAATTASSLFPPLVRLYAPSGTFVTSGVGGATASIGATGLLHTGQYTVVLRASPNNAGPYAVTLAKFPGTPTADGDGDGGPLASGQALTAALPFGDLDLYSIDLTAGSTATFRMTSLDGTIDPRLQLFGPDGVPVSTADGFSAATLNYSAPDTGRYYLMARDLTAGKSGRYSLTVNNAAVANDTRTPTVTRRVFDANRAAQRVTLQLSESLGSTFEESDLLVTRVDVGNLSTNDYVAVYDDANHVITIEFNAFAKGTLPNGAYRVTLRGGFVTDLSGNALAASDVFNFAFARGDADGNRVVDFDDFVLLQTNFGGGNGKTYAEGDFDYDGDVDFNDFVLLQTNFGVLV